MPDRRRTVFFVSDGTGITVEMLGHSLLTQFDGIEFDQMTVPFIDSVAKAEACVARINEAAVSGNGRPVVFTTLVNAEIRDTVRKAEAFVLDFFESFLDPLEAEFGAKSTHTIGRSHSARDAKGYTHRIDAINFALAHDDGASSRDLDKADVILVGVSRSGKTLSLYTDRDDQVYKGSVVILVNEGSGSGSELFSAAMQENGRAAIVGRQSCGCVLGISHFKKLKGGSELAVSELKYISPQGHKIEGTGVTPNRSCE